MKNVFLWMFLLTSLSLFSQTKSNHLYLSASKVAIDGYDLTTLLYEQVKKDIIL